MKNVLRKVYKCGMCGKDVTDVNGNKFHTACVIDDLYETYASRKSPTTTQLARAARRNIDVLEIRKNAYEDMRGMIKQA